MKRDLCIYNRLFVPVSWERSRDKEGNFKLIVSDIDVLLTDKDVSDNVRQLNLF